LARGKNTKKTVLWLERGHKISEGEGVWGGGGFLLGSASTKKGKLQYLELRQDHRRGKRGSCRVFGEKKLLGGIVLKNNRRVF